MEITKILKAMADDTRFRILILLLQHNYCVRGNITAHKSFKGSRPSYRSEKGLLYAL